MFAVASCVQFDDSDIQDEIAGIKDRLSTLEEKVNGINSDISNLWEIVNALNHKETVSAVSETDDAWTIKFSNGTTVVVKKGSGAGGPVVGVKKDTDGKYYWTLDGEWLLDDNNKKLPVTGPAGEPGASAIAPQLDIRDGYWYISTDGGKTWSKLNKATGDSGDAFFKNVTWDDSFVYFVLADGTMLKIGRGPGGALAISAVPDYADGSVQAVKDEFSIRFDVYPESTAEELAALPIDLFKLKVVYAYPTKASAGESTALPIINKEGLNGTLILTVDGTKLADEFVKGSLGANASLTVAYQETAVTSGYFPLKFYDSLNGHSYVDLGLPSGARWATMNVGASRPEEFGDYYAWGETQPYYERGYALWDNPVWRTGKGKGYDWPSYRWCDGTEYYITKYNSFRDGIIDNKRVLDPEDDAATANWGLYWRMPTEEEIIELVLQCDWTKTKQSGVDGWLATSKNGKTSLFFPSAGKYNDVTRSSGCYYWTSSRSYTAAVCLSDAYDIYPDTGSRVYGFPVHPVYGKFVPVLEVTIDPASLQLSAGATSKLKANILPSNATAPGIYWKSSDQDVATVDYEGNVTAVKDGVAVITAWSTNGLSATCTVTVGQGPAAVEPEYVDLGLSVKWATFNVGATKPEEPGDYFAWGETEPYYEPGTAMNPVWKKGKEAGYDSPSYKWSNASGQSIYKYLSNSIYGSQYGTVDHKVNLELEDDAAAVNLGGDWRMPTYSEVYELLDNCSRKHIQSNGVDGVLFTSKVSGYTDKSIFLPWSGYFEYRDYIDKRPQDITVWSSFLQENCRCAYGFELGTNGWFWELRTTGHSIRPVYGKFIPLESFSLNTTEVVLKPGDVCKLDCTFVPSNASEKSLLFFSDDTEIAYRSGMSRSIYAGKKEGTTTVTLIASNGMSAQLKVTVKAAEPVEPEYVDLGLSVKWATFNVGATKPEEPGDYFAWGETETKSEYYLSNYKWCNGGEEKLTKYCTNSSYWDSSAPMDNKTVLDAEDDAASATWGGSWRMPTDAEWTELRENCTWTWTSNYSGTGIAGRVVTAGNGNSIFLPAAGYWNYTSLANVGFVGEYWSSSLYTGYPSHALHVGFVDDVVRWSRDSRGIGFSVRPVYGEFVPASSISLDKTTLELSAHDIYQLTATVSPSNATEKQVHWISSDESVASVDENGLVTAIAEGTATITAYASNGLSTTCTVTVKAGEQPPVEPEYVDLGLSVKWATFNVGATKPEEPGDYFAWGEVQPYYEPGTAMNPVWKAGKSAGYEWESYSLCDGDYDLLNKYNDASYYGKVDHLTVLEAGDDAATAAWGGSWHMPTYEQFQELLSPNLCDWVWTSVGNVKGYIVTSKKTGNAIFLPAAGRRMELDLEDTSVDGFYWTSSLTDYSCDSYSLHFYDYYEGSDHYTGKDWEGEARCYGLSVRPVCD